MRSALALLVIGLIVPACAEPNFGTEEDAVVEGPGPRKKEPPKSSTQGSDVPPPSDAPRAPSSGSGAGGGAAPAAGCDMNRPFATQVLVSGIEDDDTGYGLPRLSRDEMRAYYSSAAGQLVRTERTTMTGAFVSSSQVLAMAGAWQPTLTQDELTMVFSRGDQNEQLYIATRSSSAVPFASATPLGSVNSSGRAQIDPYIRGDGKELFFHRYNPGDQGDRGDIYSAAITGTSVSAAQPVANINSQADDRYPVVSADGLTIYWGSNRTDLGGRGLTDIYMAKRASVAQPFSGVTNVSELNSTDDERPAWVSNDGCRLYYQKGKSLVVATRPSK